MTRGEFAASIAHETREPVSAIVTDGDVCLRWLNRDVPDLQEARTCVRRMIANAMRTDNVVARLRALANSDVSGHTLFDLNGIVGDVLPLVEHELAACDIMLDVALAPGDPRVNGDQEQLQQVLLNLVVNAIQAMEQTADRPRVLSIRSDLGAIDSAAPCAMIKASDIGPGIEAGPMSRLFAPFYTTKPQGMGMGLSACRSIVQAHGGIIDAVRGRASGAAFTMAIPIYVRAKVPARRRQSITLWQRTKVATA